MSVRESAEGGGFGRVSRPGATPAAGRIPVQAVGAILGFLGLGFVCLDRYFKIVHASDGFAIVTGKEAAGGVAGRPVEEVLGAELLGPGGTLRQALEAGERGAGWTVEVRRADGAARRVSITAAPLDPARLPPSFDQRVAYLAVVQPVQEWNVPGPIGPPITRPAATAAADLARERLLAALQAHRWRRAEAARALGISRTTLWRRMRKLRLDAR